MTGVSGSSLLAAGLSYTINLLLGKISRHALTTLEKLLSLSFSTSHITVEGTLPSTPVTTLLANMYSNHYM